MREIPFVVTKFPIFDESGSNGSRKEPSVDNLDRREKPIVRYEKVKRLGSPDDGNLIFWSSRISRHPEVTTKEVEVRLA